MKDAAETLPPRRIDGTCPRMKKIGAAFVSLLVSLVLPACGTEDVDAGRTGEAALADGADDVLVFFDNNADLAPAARLGAKETRGAFVYRALVERANETQANVLALLKAEGATFQRFHVVSAILVEHASPALVKKLAAQPEVARVSPNHALRPIELAPVAPKDEAGEEIVGDNITSTGADRVWTELGATGEGIVVAGQDTGYKWDHPALKRQYRGWDGAAADHRYSWHDAIHGAGSNPCGFDLAAPCDDQGHGTHTIGTIVGDDGGENKIGMAPGARWIGCRNMNRGSGKPSTYLECFEWFLAPYPQGGNPQTDGKPEMAPHVINNSWGCDGSEGCRGQEFVQVLKNLEAAGVMVVVSAGNSGSSCGTIDMQPATVSDHTLSVGAHNHRTNKIATFSSRGPSSLDGKVGPDVSAPGVSIRSSVKSGGYEGGSWSGTSMAGPHVAGEVALLWSAVPALKGKLAETTEIITRTAKPTTSTQTCGGVPGTATPNNTFGWGTIDAYAAVVRGLETL